MVVKGSPLPCLGPIQPAQELAHGQEGGGGAFPRAHQLLGEGTEGFLLDLQIVEFAEVILESLQLHDDWV